MRFRLWLSQLMEILDNEDHADVISWLPHGQGFMIYKKKAFEINVMSRYFKQAKFTSFTRKLNRWGFTRVTRGPETGAYYHKFFKRDQNRLCLQMTCQSSAKTSMPDAPWLKAQQQQQQQQQQLSAATGLLGAGGALGSPLGGLLLPGLVTPSLLGAATAGSSALLQQQLLHLQQQHTLQQLQQQELLRRAMASQTTNSLYLQLLQGKAAGTTGLGTNPLLMAQLQSTARSAALLTAGTTASAMPPAVIKSEGKKKRSSNNSPPPKSGSPDSAVRRALAA